MAKMLTPLLVVAVALVGRDGRVLVQQRPKGTMHAGLWEFPGGKVEPGESPERAAARELQEELGVGIDPASLEPAGFASGPLDNGNDSAEGPGRSLVLLLYVCRRWIGEAASLEGGRVGWHAPETLASLDMPPLDYPLVRALEGWLAHDFSKKISDRR